MRKLGSTIVAKKTEKKVYLFRDIVIDWQQNGAKRMIVYGIP
jgi:hypothetical protein